MTEPNQERPEGVIPIWFHLRDRMMREGLPLAPSAVRPPSLRDACYAYALAQRTATDTDEETIESFVNGLELGAMMALRTAWERDRG